MMDFIFFSAVFDFSRACHIFFPLLVSLSWSRYENSLNLLCVTFGL